MYSVLLLSALAATGSHHACPVAYCSPSGYGAPHSCGGYIHAGCCGAIAPHLTVGTPGRTIPAEDKKAWDAYLDELDHEDRAAMRETWQQADFDARVKLLALLEKLRGGKKAGNEAPAPLTEQEQEAWKAHLKTLKGDALKKAEEAWSRADLPGRRKLVEALKKSPSE